MGKQLEDYIRRKKRRTKQEADRDAAHKFNVRMLDHNKNGLDGTCMRCKKQRMKDKTGSMDMCGTCYDEKNCPECAKAESGICLSCFNKLFANA